MASLTLDIHHSPEAWQWISSHSAPVDPSFNKPSSSDKVLVSTHVKPRTHTVMYPHLSGNCWYVFIWVNVCRAPFGCLADRQKKVMWPPLPPWPWFILCEFSHGYYLFLHTKTPYIPYLIEQIANWRFNKYRANMLTPSAISKSEVTFSCPK